MAIGARLTGPARAVTMPGMGNGVAFDTLAAVETLTGAGFDEAKAKAIVATMRQAEGGLATKADIAELKADMLKVAIGIAVAIVVANAALTIALFKLFAA